MRTQYYQFRLEISGGSKGGARGPAPLFWVKKEKKNHRTKNQQCKQSRTGPSP